MAIDKCELIRRFIKSRIGAPIVDLCDPELKAVDEAVEAACTRYWLALPYQTTGRLLVSINCSEQLQTVESIKESSFGTSPRKDQAYFLGVGRYDLTGLHNINPLGTNYFDQKLLGKDFGYHPNQRPIEDPRFLADRVLAHTSTEDLLFGELDYRYDYVEEQLVFITPPVQGTVHLWYNWGFCPENTIELVPMVYFDIFKKMVALEFIEIILASRSAMSLNNADFDLDVTDLTNKRDRLQEELDKEVPDTAISLGVWG